MNSPSHPPEQPPTQRLDDSGGRQYAAWCLRIVDEGSPLPTGNRAGVFILARWIEDRLKRAGVEFVSCCASGELNKAIGMVRTPQPKRAAAVVLEVITEAQLAGFAEVYWFDAAEGCYRTSHPKAQGFTFENLFASGLVDEITAGDRDFKAKVTAYLKETNRALEGLQKRLGHEPPPVPTLPEQ